MKNRAQLSKWRMRARLTGLAALPIFMLAPVASRAAHAETADTTEESAPGTDFVACQNKAWADYNSCLFNADHEWERTLCDLAFQADVVWCGSVYWHRVKSGT